MRKLAVLLVLALFIPTAYSAEADEAAKPDDVQVRIFNYFLKRANDGDMNSQYIVGNRYETGVGGTQDEEEAYKWYTKAAEQGHEQAKSKLESRNRTSQKAVRAREQAEKTPRVREQAAKAAPVVAPVSVPKPAPRAPESSINAMDVILSGAWARNRQPAEFLPSSKTTCLPSGETDIVCFSEELQRGVGGAQVTYTVKANLTKFNNRDGSFTLQYVYNVIDIDKNKAGVPPADKDLPPDLAAKLGWQEPGHTLDCKATGDTMLTCTKDKKYNLQFVKN